MLKKTLFAGFGALISGSCLASTSESPLFLEELPMVWSSIITLSGGAAWASPGQNQYLYPNPLPQYELYRYTSSDNTMATGEIFFGLQRMVYPNLIGELGLGVAGETDATLRGFTEVNGINNVYDYSYKVNHTRVELKGRLIDVQFRAFQPYISGSFGAGFNHSHDYYSVSNYSTLYPAWWFIARSNIAFAYTLGAGLQTVISPHWQIGLGYQWGDLGRSYLARTADPLTTGLRLTHFYTNELIANISYVFS